MRKTLLPLLTLVLLTGAACDSGSGRKKSGDARKSSDAVRSGNEGGSANAKSPGNGGKSSSPTRKKTVALTCEQLESASLGSPASPYNGYPDPIGLRDGMWSGRDGVVVALQSPCAVGDLTGDDAAEAVVPVMMDGGGTGKFWQLVVFDNVDGRPSYVTVTEIGDRTPVEDVSISGGQLRVVYLTRPDDASMAEVAVRRTATYRLSGSSLREVSHTDSPYRP